MHCKGSVPGSRCIASSGDRARSRDASGKELLRCGFPRRETIPPSFRSRGSETGSARSLRWNVRAGSRRSQRMRLRLKTSGVILQQDDENYSHRPACLHEQKARRALPKVEVRPEQMGTDFHERNCVSKHKQGRIKHYPTPMKEFFIWSNRRNRRIPIQSTTPVFFRKNEFLRATGCRQHWF